MKVITKYVTVEAVIPHDFMLDDFTSAYNERSASND